MRKKQERAGDSLKSKKMKKTLILLSLLTGMTGVAQAFSLGYSYSDEVAATNIHIGNTSNDYITSRNDAINYDTTLTGTMVKWNITFTYDFDMVDGTHKSLTGNGSTIAPATNSGSSTGSLQVNVKTDGDQHAASLTYGDSFNNNAQIAFNATDTLTLSYDNETNLLTLRNNTSEATTTYDCTPHPGKTAFSSGNVRAFTQSGSIPIKVTAISGQAITGSNGIVTLADNTQKDYGASYVTLLNSGRMNDLHSDAGVKAYVVDGNAEAWFAASGSDAATVEIAADIYLRGSYTGDSYGTLRMDTSQNHTLKLNGNIVLGSDTKISSHAYNPGDAGLVEFNGTVEAESSNGDKFDLNIVHRNNGTNIVFNNDVNVGRLETDNGSVTFNGMTNVDALTVGSNKSVSVGSTGTLNINSAENTARGSLCAEGVTFTSDGENGITLTNTGSSSASYSVSSADFTIAADILKVSGGTAETTINNAMNVASLINNSSASITGIDANTLKNVDAGKDLTLNSDDLTLTNLTLGAAVTLTVEQGSTEKLVTVTGTLEVAHDAILRAHLKLANNSTFTLKEGALTLGSNVTLGENITLDGEYAKGLNSLSDGGLLTLIKAADGTTLGNIEGYNQQDASLYFAGLNEGAYTVVANTTGLALQKNGTVVPEPATATLSLLALAGLCARRRRR